MDSAVRIALRCCALLMLFSDPAGPGFLLAGLYVHLKEPRWDEQSLPCLQGDMRCVQEPVAWQGSSQLCPSGCGPWCSHVSSL